MGRAVKCSLQPFPSQTRNIHQRRPFKAIRSKAKNLQNNQLQRLLFRRLKSFVHHSSRRKERQRNKKSWKRGQSGKTNEQRKKRPGRTLTLTLRTRRSREN